MKENMKMSLKEADRLSVMRQIDKKILTLKQASEELGLSLRQLKRVRKRYLEQGERGLISLKRGKKSNRKLPRELRDEVMKLIRATYADFRPTLASEKLASRHGIKISEKPSNSNGQLKRKF